jgi:2-phosphoglycerate kinase
MRSIIAIVIAAAIASTVEAFGPGSTSRVFLGNPQVANVDPKKPKLILIGGCPGTGEYSIELHRGSYLLFARTAPTDTAHVYKLVQATPIPYSVMLPSLILPGKSTFGMSVALDQGILKCISTDTIRATMRSFVASDVSPALHRSSYAPAFDGDDPVRSWKETCKVLDASVRALVEDSMNRGTSIVVEGVHVVPSRDLIDLWEAAGGVAIGVLLQIQDPETHKRLLKKRGFITGNVGAEVKKLRSYDRVRHIQDEMMKLAKESHWLQIEQKTEPDPLDMVSAKLYGADLFNPNQSGAEKQREEAFQKAEAEMEREKVAAATQSANGAPANGASRD